MSTRLLLLSDTHLPTRAKVLQAHVWRLIDEADVVIHAGDWIEMSLFDALDARAARLVGVAGNNDGQELWDRLGEVARVQIEELRVGVIHETGSAAGRERRSDARFGRDSDAAVDLLVFGHSHIPWDTTTPSGLRLLNPGSPTDRRRQPVGTVMTAVVDGATLRDVELIPTPR